MVRRSLRLAPVRDYPIKWKKIQIIGNNDGFDLRRLGAAKKLID
jgi:hypothetical protein